MADLEVVRNETAFEIEVEVPGWTEPVAVQWPERPGEVRGAVEKLVREVGLTTG